jgi:agarase
MPEPAAPAFRAESRRGREGFFHAAQADSGEWWLLSPRGEPCWPKAVHGVRAARPGADAATPPDAAVRLRRWGFDAVGVGGDDTGWADGFAFMAAADFCAAGAVLTAPGLRLPDVFDPQWPARAQEHARRQVAPLAEQRALLGWVTDADVQWAQPSGAHAGVEAAARPTLLQLCLSLEPSFAAYHAAWEFTLALHGGRIETLARAWNAPISNRAVVRELTRAEMGLTTRGYLRDEARWTRELARRYFATTGAALRAADPNHLVLGCRFNGIVGAHVLAECAYPAVDVAMPDWRELPAMATPAGAPVLADEVDWTTPDFLKLPAAARVLRLTSLEWMLRRGRSALERLARHPAVVGYGWAQWQDQPGEQPPFARGLVHLNGAEAREHTELLADFNHRAERLRRAHSSSLAP